MIFSGLLIFNQMIFFALLIFFLMIFFVLLIFSQMIFSWKTLIYRDDFFLADFFRVDFFHADFFCDDFFLVLMIFFHRFVMVELLVASLFASGMPTLHGIHAHGLHQNGITYCNHGVLTRYIYPFRVLERVFTRYAVAHLFHEFCYSYSQCL